MRPLTDLLPHTKALERILDFCPPIPESTPVPLGESVGRVLAEAVTAAFDVPPFDRAAMDGYALRSAEAATVPARLRLAGVLHAGDAPKQPVNKGECIQVATGSPLPAGADAVIMVERTRREGETIILDKIVKARENVSAQGSDVRAGQTVLAEGTLMNPARLAVAAALGCDSLRVWRRPRVAVLSTGSELRPPGTPLKPGQIHDSNGPALTALFRLHGADVVQGGPVADEIETLRRAIKSHADNDVIVLSGASSAGEKDVLRDAVAAEGTIVFHGVRVKPGKPLLLGRVGSAAVVGLPGYPTSCLSDAYLFVLPALDSLAHRPAPSPRRVSARLSERVASVKDRLWFLPVRLDDGRAIPTYKESGATTSLSDAVGYVEIPPDVPYVDAGDQVQVVLF